MSEFKIDEKRIHKWTELPISKIDFSEKDWSKNWSYGMQNDGQWEISHTSEDLSQDIYLLPRCLNQMLNRQKEQGRIELMHEFKSLMDIEY